VLSTMLTPTLATPLQTSAEGAWAVCSWRMHMLDGCSALYRGWVIRIEKSSDSSAQRLELRTASTGRPMKIVEIAKLKCLKYIMRTFGAPASRLLALVRSCVRARMRVRGASQRGKPACCSHPVSVPPGSPAATPSSRV
jgi:hypothetical protein